MGYVWSVLVFALMLWVGIAFDIGAFVLRPGNLLSFVAPGALAAMVLGPLVYAFLNVPREHVPLLGVLDPRRLHVEEARRLVVFLATYRDASLATGGLLALLGIVGMLREAGAPVHIGAPLAVALLGLFYAVILGAVCHTALVRVGLAQRPPIPTEGSPTLEWSLYLYPLLALVACAIVIYAASGRP